MFQHVNTTTNKNDEMGGNSLLTLLLKKFCPHYGPGVDSASNRNEYQEHFLGGGGVKAAGA